MKSLSVNPVSQTTQQYRSFKRCTLIHIQWLDGLTCTYIICVHKTTFSHAMYMYTLLHLNFDITNKFCN